MRVILPVALAAAGLFVVGCEKKGGFDGPTVEAFTGRVVKDGQPVVLPDGDKVQLKLVHSTGQSFGIPLRTDGTFQIGWMPIGKYSAVMSRQPKDSKSGPQMYNVPGGFEIEAGRTEYAVELGKGWKL